MANEMRVSMYNERKQNETQLVEYFEKLDVMSVMREALSKNVQENKQKCKQEEKQMNLEMKEIDQSIQQLLNKKAKLREKLDELQETMNDYDDKLGQCDKLANEQLIFLQSDQFKQKWKEFEQGWNKWDYKQIVLWFKRIIGHPSLQFEQARSTNNDENIHGQLQDDHDETARDNDQTNNVNVVGNDHTKDDVSTTIDWELISSNLLRRELDGKFLLICDDKELIKLGFEFDKHRQLIVVEKY